MSTSQNGWPATESSANLTPLRWITGRVLPGPVHTVFDYLAARFNAEVEPITVAHSWGWAHRPVSGATVLSNHASGTAIDLNAPRHPLGARGTFTSKQVAALRRILTDLGGVVRWGGDYSGRKDEMHFEIVATPAQVAAVADRLRAPGGTITPTPAPTPVPDVQEDDMTPEQDARLRAIETRIADLASSQEIVFFESKGTVYEASLLSGTYRALPSQATLADRRAVLTAAGIPFRNWASEAGDREVANPAAFGIRV